MIGPMQDRTSDRRDNGGIGERLRLTRQALGMAQNEFSGRAGIAPNTYNQFESGRNRPSIDAAIKLSDTYLVTLDWIYLGDPSGLRYELADAIKSLRQARSAKIS